MPKMHGIKGDTGQRTRATRHGLESDKSRDESIRFVLTRLQKLIETN